MGETEAPQCYEELEREVQRWESVLASEGWGKALQKSGGLNSALKPEFIFPNGEGVKGYPRGGGGIGERRTVCVWRSVWPDGKV